MPRRGPVFTKDGYYHIYNRGAGRRPIFFTPANYDHCLRLLKRYQRRYGAATIAYCEYVHARYGRFPANSGPFRTILAHQAHHLDPDFYDRFYLPEALSDTQRRHEGGA